jgi:hypothetical protein
VYVANHNPQPDLLAVDGATLHAGAPATLTVTWPPDTAESYPVYDVATQTLVPHREALRVSWYATAGTFTDERTGRAADDPATDSSTQLTAPAGTVYIWAVLRDDRGGVGWTAAARVEVAP